MARWFVFGICGSSSKGSGFSSLGFISTGRGSAILGSKLGKSMIFGLDIGFKVLTFRG